MLRIWRLTSIYLWAFEQDGLLRHKSHLKEPTRSLQIARHSAWHNTELFWIPNLIISHKLRSVSQCWTVCTRTIWNGVMPVFKWDRPAHTERHLEHLPVQLAVQLARVQFEEKACFEFSFFMDLVLWETHSESFCCPCHCWSYLRNVWPGQQEPVNNVLHSQASILLFREFGTDNYLTLWCLSLSLEVARIDWATEAGDTSSWRAMIVLLSRMILMHAYNLNSQSASTIWEPFMEQSTFMLFNIPSTYSQLQAQYSKGRKAHRMYSLCRLP